MADLNKFQELWSDMDETLKVWCEQVKELRHPVEDTEVRDSLESLHEHLVASRRAQDRIEAILANVGRMRSRIRKLVSELEDEYDDAWRAGMTTTRIGEYMSAKEKDATYATMSFNELLALRRGKRMLADVEEVYDFVFIKHRGLENQIRDFKDRMRTISVEANYERG